MPNQYLYARSTFTFGTRSTVVIFAAANAARMTAVTPTSIDLLRRFVSAGARGIKLSALDGYDLALTDLGRLGLRFDRVRNPGHVALVGTVSVVDQRTFAREVA